MDYSKYTKDQLIARIEELEMLANVLLSERTHEDTLDFSWSGNLGHWYLNLTNGTIIFNPLKVLALGYSMEELPERVHYSYFTEKLHPDDYEPTMQGKTDVYECEYRIQTKDGGWKWFYDRGKVTRRAPDGKPEFAAGIVFDITDKKEKEQRLAIENQKLEVEYRHLAEESTTDALTGVMNRKTLMESLEAQLSQTSACKEPLSIAMFDIDNFKICNDTKGHVFGDTILRAVGQLFKDNIREQDLIGRYGGEEFLLVLPGTPTEKAQLVCDRIRAAIASHHFEDAYPVTISGGIATHAGDDMISFIDRADRKLFDAKHAGRNKVLS